MSLLRIPFCPGSSAFAGQRIQAAWVASPQTPARLFGLLLNLTNWQLLNKWCGCNKYWKEFNALEVAHTQENQPPAWSLKKKTYFPQKGSLARDDPHPLTPVWQKAKLFAEYSSIKPLSLYFFNSFCLEVGSVFFVLISLHFCFYEKQTAMRVVVRRQRDKTILFCYLFGPAALAMGCCKSFYFKDRSIFVFTWCRRHEAEKMQYTLFVKGCLDKQNGTYFFGKGQNGGGEFCNYPYKFITDF